MDVVRTTLHDWYHEHGFEAWGSTDQTKLALQLIRQNHTEDKLAGILFLQEILVPSGEPSHALLLPAFADLFEGGCLADWNSVDWFCVKVLGPLVERDGEPCARAIGEWRLASTLWQRRASAVAFVNLVKRAEIFPGFFQVLMESCEVLVGDRERFSQTGAGWVLREMGSVDPVAVEVFITDHLREMSREAVKNAVKKLPTRSQQAILALHLSRWGTGSQAGKTARATTHDV
jgi:3-methyladenine DNA glycosylase AlkD